MIAPYNCVVVANGSFPQTALPLRLLHEASVVIACDGAIEALDKAGITPAAIVGDLDSIPSCFRERYADRIHIVEDQEINDLTKSVRFAHRSGEQEVLILGATGAARRPYVRQYLVADGLRPAVPPDRNAFGLWDFHPSPANDDAGKRSRYPSVSFLTRPFRHDFHHRTTLAHPRPPADSLVARYIERSDGRQFHRHPLTGGPCHCLSYFLNKKSRREILRSAFGTKYTLNFTT